MKSPRNHDGRTSDGHEYDDDGVATLGLVPCRAHRAHAMRNRHAHAERDVPITKGSRHG